MSSKRPEWPEAGDLVIATIQNVTDYGAYAKLDEYDKQGLLHVSEISSAWILGFIWMVITETRP